MPNASEINFTPAEVRKAFKWQMERSHVPPGVIEAATETMTDESINRRTIESPQYRDDAQFMVNLYREAMARGNV